MRGTHLAPAGTPQPAPGELALAARASAPVPARAAGLQLLGDMQGSGYRDPPALVRRGDGQTLQLTPLLYLVLDAIDGRRHLDEIALHVSQAYGRSIRARDAHALIEGKLRPLGLLRMADGSEPEVRKANPLLALRFRFVMSHPDVTRRITAPFAWLFHPLIVLFSVVGFVAVSWWVLVDRGLGFAANQAFSNPGLLFLIFVVTLVSAGFHEFGHAAGARYGGATPGAMGAGLYLLWPAFYTDVTDSYRLSRRGRLRTDLGGIYFNALLALAVFAAWWITGWDALLLLIATQILQMIRQLPPLLRFDGYHILADVTGVPDLYNRIRPTLAGLLPSRWGNPETKALKPWAKAVVTLWVIAVVPFIVASILVTVVTMPRILASAASSLGTQWQAMIGHFESGDLIAGFVKLLAVVAVGLPVAGISYMLIRMVRQFGTKVWRATDGRPVRRGGAALAVAVVVAALSFAWWPHGNYRPIQPYERGTLVDALPAAFQAGGLRQGSVHSAQTIWLGAGSPPTADHPALAMVLVPRPGQTAPTWVFPFNRPPAPGPGDNQALAVNTANGSTVYQVAFALIWARGSHPVLNINSAYALARCHDCRTTAISFQVVLVVGHAHIVVPQNLSAAVNYDCVACLTQALAQQLVITLPGVPGQSEAGAINALWRQIQAFSQHLDGLSFAQIERQLLSYEHQIVTIVLHYSKPSGSPPVSAVSATTFPGAQQSPTSAPTGSSTPAGSTGTPTTAGTSGSNTTLGSTTTTTTSTVPSSTPPTSAPPSSPTSPP